MLYHWCRNLFLFGCCCFYVLSAQAQQAEDHLQPSQGYFFSYSYAASYYPKVQQALYAGLSASPLARVVVLPSFAPEYVVSIDQKGPKYYLTYQVCQASLWAALQQRGKQVAIATKAVEVSQELATVIQQTFNTAIAQTKYPKPITQIRSDGTTFVFSAMQRGIGLQGGETWSPSAGNMGALVTLVDHLKQVANTPADQQLQRDLLQEANQLTAKLKDNS
jgi:hypothetical protein